MIRDHCDNGTGKEMITGCKGGTLEGAHQIKVCYRGTTLFLFCQIYGARLIEDHSPRFTLSVDGPRNCRKVIIDGICVVELEM